MGKGYEEFGAPPDIEFPDAGILKKPPLEASEAEDPKLQQRRRIRIYSFLTLFIIFFAYLVWPTNSNSIYQLNNWMSRLDPSTSLLRISIPGTHDSGARFGGANWTCQKLTLAQQLEIGVRYLDIRCRHIEDRFDIHHMQEFQHLTFDEVLQVSKDFLKRNPSEVLIMRVKPEFEPANCTRNFSETFFTRYWDPTLFYEGNDIPLLKEARGRIYVLKNFEGGKSIGTNWKNIQLQDDWVVDAVESKRESIQNFYQKAINRSANDSSLYVNHFSGSGTAGTPAAVSQEMSKLVPTFTNKLCGMIPMDFVEESLSRHLVSLNFQ